MRLISCHIENFGVLSNKDYTFEAGINSFCKENGVGKTTLAAFIRAMFYGFDNKLNKDFSDRKHYYPFQGGNINYGGNLTFESKGKIYRIERNFDVKSESKDQLEIIDEKGNKIPFDKTKKPGEVFFEIDLNSFIRTIFVSSNDLLIESTPSIHQKLGGFVNNIDAEAINKKLEKSIHELEKHRKGSEGIIERINIEINAIDDEIRDIDVLSASLPEKYNQYNQLEQQILDLQKLQNAGKDQEILKAKYKAYDEMENELVKAKKEKEEINVHYPQGFPNDAEMQELKEFNEKEHRINGSLKNYCFTEEEKNNYSILSAKYLNGVFSNEELSEIRNAIVRKNQTLKQKEMFLFTEGKQQILEQLQKDFETGIPSTQTIEAYDEKVVKWRADDNLLKTDTTSIPPNMIELQNQFSIGRPTEEELNHYQEKVERYTENDASIRSYSDSLLSTQVQTVKPQSKTLPIVITSLGGILLIAGIILLFVQLIIGISLAIVGGIGTVIGLTLIFKKSTIVHQEINTELQNKLAQLKDENDKLAIELRSFFAQYRLSGDQFGEHLNNIKNSLKYLDYFEQQEAKNNNTTKENQLRHQEEYKDIISFYSSYHCIAEDISKLPSLLKDKISTYNRLLEEKQKFEQQQKVTSSTITQANLEITKIFELHKIEVPQLLDEALIQNLEEESRLFYSLKEKKASYEQSLKDKVENDTAIHSILKKYGLRKDEDFEAQYSSLTSNRRDYFDLNNKIKKYTEEMEKYKKENHLQDSRPEFVEMEADETIDKKITEYHLLLTTINEDIKTDEEKIGQIDDLKAERDKLYEKKKASEIKLENLKLLKDCFNEAENNLKEKYIGPMEKSFVKYSKQINQALSNHFKMDFDFNIKYDIAGKDREYKHLSEGQKACLSLCLRLAMIENMYPKEKLIMILDDPFVNLDANNIKNCLSVLKEISSQIQIIYFCCHESRNMK